MLSDEEKEIFNNLKDYMQSNIDNGYHKFIYNDLGWDFKCIDCINAIDKVLKQSKEIEELKRKEQLIKTYKGNLPENVEIICLCKNDFERNISDDYISKDKIKAKIEEEDKLFFKTKDVRHANRYKAYKELLEKE